MRIHIKKIFVYIIAIFMLSFTGCNKFSLDLAPVSEITEGNFWKTPAQFEAFMEGIHSRYRGHVNTFFILGGHRADDFGDENKGPAGLNGSENYWNNTLTEIKPGISNFGGFYSNINQLNLFILRTNESTILSDAEKNYLLGQAYGIRAYYYFQLLRTWGDVVVTDEPSISFDIANLEKSATPSSEVMAFVKKDIENSVNNFQMNYSFHLNRKSFWSKLATLMLKAEVYLWSSKQMGGGISDASVAKAALVEIQNNVPSLRLLDDYKDIFDHGNKGNNEIIFASHSEIDEPQNLSFWFHVPASVVDYVDSLTNMQMDDLTYPNNGRTGGFYAPIKMSTFRAFDNNDTRKYVSIQGLWKRDGDNFKLESAYLLKYKGEIDGGKRVFTDDFIIYRYADLLLLLAEAKAVLGEDFSSEINAIRKRAYLANYVESIHAYPNQPGDDNAEEALLKERRFEFVGEAKRWYDLRRFGKQYVFKYTTVKEDYQLLWPIDIGSLTNNGALVQNPGY